jgi:hypothetical protein
MPTNMHKPHKYSKLFKIMTEQQQHLSQALEQQKDVVNDINNLTNQLTVKKELALKLQGIIEYLDQIGVTLPDEEEEEETKQESA